MERYATSGFTIATLSLASQFYGALTALLFLHAWKLAGLILIPTFTLGYATAYLLMPKMSPKLPDAEWT